MPNIIIEGNIIQNGKNTGGAYSYDNSLYANAPANIVGNSFFASNTGTACDVSANAPSVISENEFNCVATTLLSTAAKSNIVNNKFVGNTTTTVLASVSAKCIVSANSFTGNTATSLLTVTQDSTISNNNFDVPVTLGTFVTLTGCKCTVTNNKFIRDAVGLTSYISITGASGHQIRDNSFDSPTTDGATETLVSGVTNGDVVESNYNQTGYLVISAAEYTHSSSYYIGNSTSDAFHFKMANIASPFQHWFAEGIIVLSGSLVGVASNVLFYADLSRFLPQNTKVLSTLIGLRYNTIGNNTTTNSIRSFMHKTAAARPINASFGAPTSTLASVNGTPNNLDASLGGSNTTITPLNTTNEWYVNDDWSNLSAYTSQTQDLVYRLELRFTPNIGAGINRFYLSPLLVKYRWA